MEARARNCPSWILLSGPLSLADSTIINCGLEYNSLPEFCESFEQTLACEGSRGETPESTIHSRECPKLMFPGIPEFRGKITDGLLAISFLTRVSNISSEECSAEALHTNYTQGCVGLCWVRHRTPGITNLPRRKDMEDEYSVKR